MTDRSTTLRVVGFAGSLRAGSYNRALLRAAQDLAPAAGMTIDIAEIGDLPLFNEDVEAAGVPDPVLRLRSAVAAADGLLIATPEYNHGVPGVLKNAVDWLSRPPRGSVLAGKPAAILGASKGMTGTARGQSQLRQSFVFTDTPTMLQPEILVARAQEKFDADGELTDADTRTFLGRYLESFAGWIRRFSEDGG
jgi:chromate reductase, NAD(P)H dehydrogenase (quinone)